MGPVNLLQHWLVLVKNTSMPLYIPIHIVQATVRLDATKPFYPFHYWWHLPPSCKSFASTTSPVESLLHHLYVWANHSHDNNVFLNSYYKCKLKPPLLVVTHTLILFSQVNEKSHLKWKGDGKSGDTNNKASWMS